MNLIYECKKDKDLLDGEEMEACELCFNLGNQYFTCQRTNRVAVASLMLGGVVLVVTPCVDSMRVRK